MQPTAMTDPMDSEEKGEAPPFESAGVAVQVEHDPDEIPETAEEIEARIQGSLRDEVALCEQFIDSDISIDRAQATRYYRGDDFGDEEEGRSQMVMPIVRDAVRATLPGLMKTFFGGQNVVEFSAAGNGPSSQDSQDADDATATVNHVILNQNEGWLLFYGVFKDALRNKTGWVTWWQDKSPKVSGCTYSGVTEEQLQAYASVQEEGEDVQIVNKKQVGENPGQPGPPQPVMMTDPATGQPRATSQMQPGQPGPPVPVYEYTIRVVTSKKQNRTCVDSVPPEEIIYSRESSSIDGHRRPRLIGRRRSATRSEMQGLGISEEFLDENAGVSNTLSWNTERLTRQPLSSAMQSLELTGTEDQRTSTLYDLYYCVDMDGDGISELRHIVAVGENVKIWSNEYADEVPLALFCPDPEPHLMVGLSQADSLMDLQLMWSHVMRDVMDSLKLSIFPRTAYVEGQANVDDVLNTEMGAAIRMRAPGMVQPFTHDFTGQQAFPLFDLFDKIQERRTGVSAATMGMDGSALQSTTAGAAQASISASQQMIELIARIFAETGMKRVFKGVLRLVRDNQDSEMQFRLNGRNYKVNPSKWGELDVGIDTGLGVGSESTKLNALTAHADYLQGQLGSMGIDNPMSSLVELYNTRKKILEIAGIRDIQRYMRDPSAPASQGKQIQSPQSPEQVVADAEIKIKGRVEDRQTLAIILEDERVREKQDQDLYLGAAEISGKYGTQVDMQAIKAMMHSEKLAAAHTLAIQTQPAAPDAPGG